MIALNAKVTKAQDQLTSEIDGKIISLGMHSGKYFVFDDISTVIWKRLDADTVIADLCAQLAQEYRTDLSLIQKEVCDLLAVLEENRLISVSPA